MFNSLFDKFRRVTASTNYLPEIDGLRFLAVFWVVVVMHSVNYMNAKFYNAQLINKEYWKWFMLEGTHGMYLFFMISGFILSLPFAKWHLQNEERVNLKRYYIRRLVRLEPPYIIALILFFLAHAFILKRYSLDQLLPSLFASTFYLHDLIYNQHSLIMPVAWSLEIEVQFYILAPLFCLIFQIKRVLIRRSLFILLIISGALYFSYAPRYENILRFAHYFFTGMLLADLNVTKDEEATHSWKGFSTGIIALVLLFVFPSKYVFPQLLIKLALLFILFYQVLFNKQFKDMFSVKWVTIIGGMCYSIYLLHFGILSCFGVIGLSVINAFDINYAPIFLLAITFLILVISASYFYYVEKPFMKLGLQRKEKPIAYNPE